MKQLLSGGLKGQAFPDRGQTLVQWQETSLTFIFSIVCIAAVPALIKSNLSAVRDGLWINLCAFNVSYLICFVIVYCRSIPFKVRAWVGMAIFFGLGTLSLVTVGPLGSGRIWLYTTAILTTLILGIRPGMVMLAGQAVFMTGFWLISRNTAPWSDPGQNDTWVTVSLTLFFLSFVSVLAMGRLIRGIAASLDASRAVGAKLRETTQKLEQQVRQNDRTITSLKESEERWLFALEGAGDGVWDWHVESGRVFFSPRWKKLLGYGKNDIGQTIEEWFGRILPEDKDQFDHALEQVFQQQSRSFRNQHRIICENGDIKWMIARGKIIQRSDQGAPLRMIGTHADITAIKALENKQREYESRLQQAHKMEAIGTLAGGIAHDFNNILFPILGHTEMLMSDLKDGDTATRHSLDQIYQSGMRARELVRQILTFSRQETSVFSPVQIQIILKETVKMLRSTIPTHIDIKQAIDPGCRAVNADPTQIHQITMNLATNAYHAMGSAPGELRIHLTECDITPQDSGYLDVRPGKFVCLAVADTGTGIAPDSLKKIFDPFFTTKEKGKGTGMGLAMVHGIVKKMKGTINVYTEPGQGTEFKVYLPVAPDKEAADHHGEGGSASFVRGTERVLLVDDEAAILDMERPALERLGYAVTPVMDPVEALDIFSSAPDQFDIVITDMSMPKMTGARLASDILAIRPDMPVIICTGFSETLSSEAAAKMGVQAILLKPILISDLSRRIRSVLDRQRAD